MIQSVESVKEQLLPVFPVSGRRQVSNIEFHCHIPSKQLSGVAGTLTSTFNLDDDYSALTKRTETLKVTFTSVHCVPEGTEGRHVLTKDGGSKTGAIDVNKLILSVCDRGKSKDVHKVCADTL